MQHLATMFLGALALTGALAAQPKGPIAQNEPRKMARVVVFGETVSEYTIQYGLPEWRDEYAAQLDALTKGKRWRFGRDFWTTLDTSVTLTIAGKKIKPGYYYLALERDKKDVWNLVVLEPDKIRKSEVDAFMAASIAGGTAVPLAHAEGETAKTLEIELKPSDDRHASLEIRFGPHRLSATIEASS